MSEQGSNRSTKEEATERLVRSMMVEQKRTVSRKTFPDLQPADETIVDSIEDDFDDEMELAPAPHSPRSDHQQAVREVMETSESREDDVPYERLSVKQRILNYRPTRKHIFWAVIALIMVLRPWLIPGLLFLAFWVGLIAWLTIGPDRMGEWLQSGWDRLSTRRPQLAERIRRRADRFALKFDAFLDKLPESWAEKLALPDMSAPVAEEDDLAERPDPFDRLTLAGAKLPEVYRG